MARENPQSGVGCNSTSPNVSKDIVGNKPRHPELDSVDVCEVARTNPLSDVGRIGTSLDVGNDIGSRLEQVEVKQPLVAYLSPLSEIGCNSTSLDVSSDIGSGLEQVKVDEPINLGGTATPVSVRGTVSSVRRQRRQMAAA